MKIKTIGLACGITLSTLLTGSCGKSASQRIIPQLKSKTAVEVKKCVRNDSILIFFKNIITNTHNENGIEHTDTVTGFLKTPDDDIIKFIMRSKRPPKDAVKIGKYFKDGSINYIG